MLSLSTCAGPCFTICSTKYVPEEAEVIIDNYFDDPVGRCRLNPVEARRR
jgi:hypothetical protein